MTLGLIPIDIKFVLTFVSASEKNIRLKFTKFLQIGKKNMSIWGIIIRLVEARSVRKVVINRSNPKVKKAQGVIMQRKLILLKVPLTIL